MDVNFKFEVTNKEHAVIKSFLCFLRDNIYFINKEELDLSEDDFEVIINWYNAHHNIKEE